MASERPPEGVRARPPEIQQNETTVEATSPTQSDVNQTTQLVPRRRREPPWRLNGPQRELEHGPPEGQQNETTVEATSPTQSDVNQTTQLVPRRRREPPWRLNGPQRELEHGPQRESIAQPSASSSISGDCRGGGSRWPCLLPPQSSLASSDQNQPNRPRRPRHPNPPLRRSVPRDGRGRRR